MQWAGQYEEMVELFALKTPRVRAEIDDWGVYEGPASIKRLYIGVHRYIEGDRVGTMFLHTITTPCIEIAGDGKTAKGLWVSPGHETFKVKNKLQAFWSWWKFGVDFVKEDGKWKIWHLLMCGMFRTPFEKSWVDSEPLVMTFPDELKADRPSTYKWIWRPNISNAEYVPALPQPYDTWHESTAYVK